MILNQLKTLNRTIRKNLLDTIDIHKCLKKIIKENSICKDCPFEMTNKKVITNSQEYRNRKKYALHKTKV